MRAGRRLLLDDKALAILEFPAIRERLARATSFSAGRALALDLRPVADRDRAVRRQRETAEAVRLRTLRVEVGLGGVRDVRASARAAGRGQVLAPSELLEIADLARASTRIRRTFARVRQETPLLSTRAAGLADLEALRGLIAAAVDERGEVRDSTSRELETIRRERDAVHGRLQQRMEALLRSSALRPALQDPIVTLRDGRYVLPVRAESRSAVPGIVHDTSASGATIYVEPLAVVDLGNRWRELQAQERHEIERIMRTLSEAAGEAEHELVDAVERLARIDLALAKASLAEELDASDLTEAGSDVPWLVEAPAALLLVGARHPLLDGEVVPVTIEAGGETRALLITGPNTGGKTVALKTAGLLSLMALAGLPVPADEGTRIPVYDAVFADIGDEQSIEQSLSTFSGHVTAIIDILERAGERSLVLLDELGAGTDPTEGAALAIAIVGRLIEAGATLIATTHHSELKLFAHRDPAVRNASVEFDVETLAPTYRLRIGVPGQSNALAIAERLGMPGAIVEAAREGLSHEQRDLEAVLGELRAQLSAAEDRAARAAADRDAAEELRADLEQQLAALADEGERLRAESRERVREEVRDAERMLQRARREVESARLEQAAADLERAREAAAALAPEPPPEPVADALPAAVRAPRTLPEPEIGSQVWLRGIGSPGEALSEPDEAGEFQVQLGALRTRVRLAQVERIEQPDGEVIVAVRTPPAPSAPEQIEIRGQIVAEALPSVEAFLDDAARAGRERVRIIHGKGTGALRSAVRELLDRHPLVTAYETGTRQEGGDGVTVALLAAVR
ncbi:MAG: endonuclease MutS2 [Chloroflexi bacterium]|nr:endonuclease MutS2 [Chloroflexota bacterium]